MQTTNKSQAELKVQKKQSKSILVSLLIAFLIIALAVITTFFEFETYASKIVIAAIIVSTSILCSILLVRWLKSIDEFESTVNARACLIAMYSSLLYLPIQYLSEIGLIPELHAAFLFMFMWFVYLIAIVYNHFK